MSEIIKPILFFTLTFSLSGRGKFWFYFFGIFWNALNNFGGWRFIGFVHSINNYLLHKTDDVTEKPI